MTASVRSVASAGADGSFSVPNPSGATTGDILVAVQATTDAGGSPSEPTAPSGWTKIRTDTYASKVRITSFYRTWTSGSFTFNNSGSCESAVIIAAVQGADVPDSTSAADTSSTTSLALSAATAVEGGVILSVTAAHAYVYTTDGSTTHPSGMTDRGDQYAIATDLGEYGVTLVNASMASLDNTAAGSTGTKTWSISADSVDGWIGYMIRLPAASTAARRIGWGVIK